MTEKITSAGAGATVAPEKISSGSVMTEAAEEIAAMGLREDGDSNGRDEKLVCFVCTGNTCRSPMAAAWLNHIAKERNKKAANDGTPTLRAISAGLYPHEGDPLSRGATAALTASEVESSANNPWREHRATRICESIMEKCSSVVGISGSHALALITEFPQYAGKICAMPSDISDPFGGDDEQYRLCLEDIKKGIGDLFGE